MTEKNDKPVMINIAVKRILKAQERVDTNRTEAEFIWKEQKFTGKDNSVASDSGETPKKIVANNRTEAEFFEKHTPTPEAAKVEETVNNVQKKAPDEHNFTWKEQKFTGKDDMAISESGDTPVKTVAQCKGILNSGR